MRVLVADDDPTTLELLQDLLAGSGYEAIGTADGTEAWRLLQNDRTLRLALLDWQMPGMDGVEICRRLQAELRSSFVYAILLTGRGNADDVAIALAEGASDYLVKPFRSSVLLARLSVGRRIIELQSRLAHAQKLESLGQLAAGIAHEINTPTQFIGDNVRFLRDGLAGLVELLNGYRLPLQQALTEGVLAPDVLSGIRERTKEVDVEFLSEEIPRAAAEALEGTARISRIVQALKRFSCPNGDEPTIANVNDAVQTTLTVARNEWADIAEIVEDYDRSLPEILCYPADLNQAILNLIVNAAYAIRQSLRKSPSRKGRIVITTRLREGCVELRVADNGCGIPEAIRQRVFDPFFTTKEVGMGTGQGLGIAWSVVVEKHKGTISFDTEASNGTTFIIRLPIGDGAI